MPGSKNIFSAQALGAMLADMAEQIMRRSPQTPCLVGIRTGGAVLSARLAALLSKNIGQPILNGAIDINLYRDDWSLKHIKPQLGSTEIDFDLQGRRVVLVDDVLYTGRTIRAALDALLDLGRPQRIELAVLIDRGGRELPIAPDYVGAMVPLDPGSRVDVHLSELEGRDQVLLQTMNT